jgi:uncharacterized protein YllA (UPF0747 family)
VKNRALAALAEAVAAYEEEFGEISEEELAAQARSDRESAIVIRGEARSKKSRARGKKHK